MKIFILDTETDGLISSAAVNPDKIPSVMEFYGLHCDIETAEIISDFHALIKPYKFPMTETTIKASKTTLSNDMLADAPRFAEVAPAIKAEIEKATAVLAHNLGYDYEVINLNFARLGTGLTVDWPRRRICTIEQTMHIKGYRMNLGELHKFLFGEEFEDAHRAKPDVMAKFRVACRLFEMGEL